MIFLWLEYSNWFIFICSYDIFFLLFLIFTITVPIESIWTGKNQKKIISFWQIRLAAWAWRNFESTGIKSWIFSIDRRVTVCGVLWQLAIILHRCMSTSCFAGSILYGAFFKQAGNWKPAELRIDKSFSCLEKSTMDRLPQKWIFL